MPAWLGNPWLLGAMQINGDLLACLGKRSALDGNYTLEIASAPCCSCMHVPQHGEPCEEGCQPQPFLVVCVAVCCIKQMQHRFPERAVCFCRSCVCSETPPEELLWKDSAAETFCASWEQPLRLMKQRYQSLQWPAPSLRRVMER